MTVQEAIDNKCCRICTKPIFLDLDHNVLKQMSTIQTTGYDGRPITVVTNNGKEYAHASCVPSTEDLQLAEMDKEAKESINPISDEDREELKRVIENMQSTGVMLIPKGGDMKFEYNADGNMHGIVRDIIRYIGDDPERESLKETPERVVRAWKELFSGYLVEDPKCLLKIFTEEKSDAMVLLKNVEFYSMCEHHMLPFFGHATIGYIPQSKKIVGISKLARLLEVFSRRLQVQERMTYEIANTLFTSDLAPLGSACVMEAKHLCMCGRGVHKQSSTLLTESLFGAFREPAVRAEFINYSRS